MHGPGRTITRSRQGKRDMTKGSSEFIRVHYPRTIKTSPIGERVGISTAFPPVWQQHMLERPSDKAELPKKLPYVI